jgi:predicted N-acyltransferase
MIKPGLCEEDKEMLTMQMASTIRSIAYSNKLTSANVNFMLEEEVEQFLKVGYTLRETIQYRYRVMM